MSRRKEPLALPHAHPFELAQMQSVGAGALSGRTAAASLSHRLGALRTRSAQLRVDAGEGAVERSAEIVDRVDDGNRDAGGDQSILDRGGAGLVRAEGSDNPAHCD